MTGNGQAVSNFFLPDFCGLRAVFAVVLLGEIFALILVLAGNGYDLWGQLGLTSLFIQWIVLSGSALLCALRPWLGRLSDLAAGLSAYAILLAVIGLSSLLVLGYSGWSGVPLVANGSEFLSRSLLLGALVSALVLRYLYMRQQWQLQLRAEAEARIQALQARIRPHFLFNSLNTIAALTHSNPTLAEEAVEDLAELMRAALGDGRNLVPLGEELKLCRHYAEMETLRLGERLQLEWDTEGLPEQVLLPPLTLQPLLENAVYHGIEPRLEGGVIHIAGRVVGEVLELEMENPVESGDNACHGNQLALENTRQRLALHFGEQASLQCEAGGGRYRVVLRIPCSLEAPA